MEPSGNEKELAGTGIQKKKKRNINRKKREGVGEEK